MAKFEVGDRVRVRESCSAMYLRGLRGFVYSFRKDSISVGVRLNAKSVEFGGSLLYFGENELVLDNNGLERFMKIVNART